MLRTLKHLWNDDDGFVLSSEMVMYGTVGVVGVTAGAAALRDTVNSELDDVAKAIGSIDQSYYFSGTAGHSAWTAGSVFFDRADKSDVPPLTTLESCPPPGRPLVCADVFGPGAKQVPPPAAGVKVKHPVKGHGPAVIEEKRSKGVATGEPGPAVVVGAPGLAPAVGPHPVGPAVNITVDPANGGPYLVDVPEGYFTSRPPTGYVGPAAHYHLWLQNQYGRFDCGYRYAPVAAPLVAAPAIIHTGPAHHGPHPHHQGGVDPRKAGWDTIDLGFAKVGDDELKHVEKFRTAKCLHVLGSNVTNKGLAYVGELTQLESLHLIGTQVTDDGLAALADLKELRFLHLVGTKITDKGLRHIAALKKLEELDVRGTPVTDEGLNHLRKALPTLRVIR